MITRFKLGFDNFRQDTWQSVYGKINMQVHQDIIGQYGVLKNFWVQMNDERYGDINSMIQDELWYCE